MTDTADPPLSPPEVKVPGFLAHLTRRLPRNMRRHIHWALIHVALMFFFADLLGAIWPAFKQVWEGIAHLGVALAAFLATAAEYFATEGNT